MDIIAEARKLRSYIEEMSVNLDDESALDNIDVFPKWRAGVSYEMGDRVRYNEVLYKVLQAHISQEDWTPDIAVSLYVNIADPQEEFPEWKQPVGSHDAYPLGSKVSHNEKHWISTIDANVYEPGVYGWDEVPLPNEEPTEPEVPEEPTELPLFVAGQVYNTGDRVMFEDKIYRSLIDNNVWSPADYPQGWTDELE